MRMRIDCCWGCPDRVADPNCHGYCEKYKQQKAEYEETMEAKKKQDKLESGLSGQTLEGLNRASHRRNLYKKNKKWW